ncbi:MAG: flagellar motor protein MotP [Chlamydiales bacterium]|nr:flagellar motor protein MotP [Chlamydiales bacterium]
MYQLPQEGVYFRGIEEMKKLDLASWIGFFGSWGIVGLGMLMSASWDINVVYALYINQYDSMALTVGGSSLGLVCSFPVTKLKKFFTTVKEVFSEDPGIFDLQSLVNELVEYATEARRNGVLALDSKTADIKDSYIRSGIQMAVDGTAPEQIEEIMHSEIQAISKRHEDNQDLISKWAELAPAYGMIGTLVGLVAMLSNLSDPSSLGPSMAVAIITTMYGSMIANMICIPFMAKLKLRTKLEVIRKEMILTAILSIQNGDNPRIVKQKLLTYVSPEAKEEILKAESAAAT